MLAGITALFSFGGWLYQSDHHGWGTFLLVLGVVCTALVVFWPLALFVDHKWLSLKQLRITRVRELAGEPVPPELSQFLTAWMIPAWDNALNVLLALRGKVRSDQGERIEDLLKMGVVETAASARTSVQHRLDGERTDAIDPLVAAMYEKYELIVRWIWETGEMVEWYGPPHVLKEWREADDKLLDHLRGLVNLPNLNAPALRGAFKKLDEGGIAKIMRKNLAAQENRLVCEPTIVVDADYAPDHGVAAYVVLRITGAARNARGRLASIQPMSNEDAIRKTPMLNYPAGLLQWSAKYGGSETATFATECELDILAFENEDDAATVVYLNEAFRKNKLLLDAATAWLVAVEVFGEDGERGSCWFRVRRGKGTVFAQASRNGTLYPTIDRQGDSDGMTEKRSLALDQTHS